VVKDMNDDWSNLPRFSKLASAMFPDLVDAERRQQMEALARGEGKKLKGPALLSHEERGATSPLGGQAKPWTNQKG
jgi:hypothetical protein